jgi:hypothetical protein
MSLVPVTAALAASPGFTPQGFIPQERIGATAGDQWEPAIAADGYGHVYILYPQYGVLPECPACPLPTMLLAASEDNGVTWQKPRSIAPPDSGQFDPQIVIDSMDHRTVYAAWVQNNKYDTVVAKSTDFGQSWSLTLADRTHVGTDKPIVAVRGQDVYVGYSHTRKMFVSSSHDGGITFTPVSVAPNATLAGASAGGGTVDPGGNVYFAWAGYEKSRRGKKPVNLYISKSSDGGATWTTRFLDVSGAPPDCSAYHCEEEYLAAQVTMASDAAGTLYALWNAGHADGSPQRIYFASSTTQGATWSPKMDVSTAPGGVEHAFPALAAGSAGDVRIAWMDSRNRLRWNTYYRSSTSGGAIWTVEYTLSGYRPGYHYIQPDGFSFPFGDYFEMDIDSRGQTQAVWGEGLNYKSPGSIWHSSGR